MGAIVTVDQQNPSPEVVDRAVSCAKAGGVLVMPTDSVYGIGCAATADNPAHMRIFDIKHRDRAQTLPWLVADVEDLERYGRDISPAAFLLARKCWPGALTLVVRASGEVPKEYVLSATQTIALRLPASELVRQIARGMGVPMATTSANTHGATPATSGHGVEARIVEAVDLTLDGGPAPIAVPSTIVDCTTPELRILREGAIPGNKVRELVS